jgi:protein-disulfide isomerase
MRRRLFVFLLRRALVATLLLCFGCAAQSISPATPDLNKRIERQVRALFQLPATVDVTVVGRKPNQEFANFDTVTVQLSQGPRKLNQDFLISKDNDTLVRFTNMDLAKDPYTEIMKKIDISGRPVLGDPNAKVTIVNFDDFECPFCARMHQTLMQDIMKNYAGRVRLIYKDFPLTEIHPWAIHAAVDANCLAAQNGDAYWDFANQVHGNQRAITGEDRPLPQQFDAVDRITTEIGQKHNLQMTTLAACVKAQNDAAVKASRQEGDSLGVSATPAMFINGEKVDGAVPAEDLHAIIDRALRDAGQNPGAATTATAANK